MFSYLLSFIYLKNTLCDKDYQCLETGRLFSLAGYSGFLHQQNWVALNIINLNTKTASLFTSFSSMKHRKIILLSLELFCVRQATEESCTWCCLSWDHLSNEMLELLWKYFYSLASIFVVSTKCIDPWVLELLISNTRGNNKWEKCISLDFNFRGLSETRKSQKLEAHY